MSPDRENDWIRCETRSGRHLYPIRVEHAGESISQFGVFPETSKAKLVFAAPAIDGAPSPDPSSHLRQALGARPWTLTLRKANQATVYTLIATQIRYEKGNREVFLEAEPAAIRFSKRNLSLEPFLGSPADILKKICIINNIPVQISTRSVALQEATNLQLKITPSTQTTSLPLQEAISQIQALACARAWILPTGGLAFRFGSPVPPGPTHFRRSLSNLKFFPAEWDDLLQDDIEEVEAVEVSTPTGSILVGRMDSEPERIDATGRVQLVAADGATWLANSVLQARQYNPPRTVCAVAPASVSSLPLGREFKTTWRGYPAVCTVVGRNVLQWPGLPEITLAVKIQ